MGTNRLSTLLVIVLATTVVACDGEPDSPSIVLISVDTLRADHLSSYGYARATPHIDALAATGVLFEDAHTVAPWTLPAHMTMLTGTYPSTHGVDNEGFALAGEVPTLAEALTRSGYRAAGFVAHHYLAPTYGFDRGFGDGYTYEQYLNDPAKPAEAIRGDRVVAAAADYLERTRDDEKPYFLFVHLFDPHWTYSAPEPFAGRYSGGYTGSMDGTLGRMMPAIAAKRPLPRADLQQLIDLYDEEIAWVDHLVGRLVAKIRQLPGGDRTVIVFTSDHGEEFEDHGSLGHSVTLYREQTHVPLIIVDPADGGARRVPNRVGLVDLAATIGHLAGLPDDDPFLRQGEGRALHLGDGEFEDTGSPLVIETTRYGHPRAAAIVGRHKAIGPMDYDFMGIQQTDEGPRQRAAATWRRRLELYDVESDPYDRSPLPLDTAADAIAFLRNWQERTWRGVQLAVRPTAGWRIRLRFPSGTTWFDEPWMENGVQTLRLDAGDHVLELGGFPPGRTYRIGLPIYLADGAVLTLEGLAGDVVLLAGERELSLETGKTRQLDLSSPELLAAGAAAPLAAGQLRIRTRARPMHGEVSIDPETRRLLESLGYVGN